MAGVVVKCCWLVVVLAALSNAAVRNRRRPEGKSQFGPGPWGHGPGSWGGPGHWGGPGPWGGRPGGPGGPGPWGPGGPGGPGPWGPGGPGGPGGQYPPGPPPWANNGTRPLALAHCFLAPAQGYQVFGHVFLHQMTEVGPVELRGVLWGLAPGLHGFHIHENGSVDDNCLAAGPHFNPQGVDHGGPKDEEKHHGDLGNVEADKEGVAKVEKTSKDVTLLDKEGGVVNRTIVVHAMEDDLGKGEGESKKTGNAGARLACCVIESGRRNGGGWRGGWGGWGGW